MPARKGLRPRFAIIPTNGRECLKDCLQAIEPQVDSLILIYTTPWHEKEIRPRPLHGVAVRDLRPPNISRWWNQGLELAQTVMGMLGEDEPGRYDVAIINDDVIVPPGWFDAVCSGLREYAAAAACSGGGSVFPLVQRDPGAVPLDRRMQGFAFMLAGEKNIRANEDLRWYFSDDYIDWVAREQGGMVMIPGYSVQHLYPNGQMTGELHQMCAEDAGKFQSLWGRMPW